jgi:hypothetical protein
MPGGREIWRSPPIRFRLLRNNYPPENKGGKETLQKRLGGSFR